MVLPANLFTCYDYTLLANKFYFSGGSYSTSNQNPDINISACRGNTRNNLYQDGKQTDFCQNSAFLAHSETM